LSIVVCCVLAAGAIAGENETGTTLQDGVLTYARGHFLTGHVIPAGADPYGYNYQEHLFAGSYANAYLGRDGFPPYEGDDETYLAAYPEAAEKWYWPYRGIQLLITWNEAWLSNKDRDGDGKLDRYHGFNSYIGSGAWCMNHQSGQYEGDNDKPCTWSYSVRIVAAPADAVPVGGVWYAADGAEIGSVIWGAFAIVQKIENDPCADLHGRQYITPVGPGLGTL
jgi:hypothetical protein